MLYELVTGSLPHQAQSTELLLEANCDSTRAPASGSQEGLTNMVDDTLKRSLEREPSGRFQSAAEMREALEAALLNRREAPSARAFGFAPSACSRCHRSIRPCQHSPDVRHALWRWRRQRSIVCEVSVGRPGREAACPASRRGSSRRAERISDGSWRSPATSRARLREEAEAEAEEEASPPRLR